MITSKIYYRSLVRVLIAGILLLGAVNTGSGQNKKITRQPVKEEKVKEKPKTNPAPKHDNKPKKKDNKLKRDKDLTPSPKKESLRDDLSPKNVVKKNDSLKEETPQPIASPGTQFEFQGMKYKVIKAPQPSCELSKGKNEANINIPSEVNYKGINYMVTSIGESAFEEFDNLQQVIIPNSVTSIGSFAFNRCKKSCKPDNS